MNASYHTKWIARGIMLKAAVNDMTTATLSGSKEEKAWNAWCAGSSDKDVIFAAKEAYDLFDRVNNAKHDGKL